MGTSGERPRFAARAGRGNAESAGGLGRPARPHRGVWRCADRDDVSASDLGRAAPARLVVGGGNGCAARLGPGERDARASHRDRPRLHGLHGCGDGCRRRTPTPCPALDGPACFSGGRRDQRHRRSRIEVRLGPGLSRMDAAQGALAQAERAGCLRPCAPDSRMHRLDDVSPDGRVDACR